MHAQDAQLPASSSSGKTQLLLQTALYTALGLASDPLQQFEASHAAEASIVFRALKGYGMKERGARSSIAILTPDGSGAGLMMTRRLCEMCDYAIRERWYGMRAQQAKQCETQQQQEPSDRPTFGAGRFHDPDDVEVVDELVVDLERLIAISKALLLKNVHFLSIKSYDEVDHAISYMLPALADQLASTTQSPLQLIILDDLPAMLLGAEPAGQMQRAVHRSQMICELSDKLRRLALYCAGPAGHESSAAAIVLGNHVVDSFERTKELAIPVLRSIWEKSQRHSSSGEGYALFDAAGDPPPLQADQQELFFSGVLSSAHPTLLGRARSRAVFRQGGGPTGKMSEEEIWNSVASGLKMAALGYQWANCISVRLMLHRTAKRIDWARVQDGSMKPLEDWEDEEGYEEDEKERQKMHNVRRAVLIKSPFVQSGALYEPSVDFVVLGRGIRSVRKQMHESWHAEETGEGEAGIEWEDEEQEEPDEAQASEYDEEEMYSVGEERSAGQGSGLEGDQLWSFVDGRHFDENALASMDILLESPPTAPGGSSSLDTSIALDSSTALNQSDSTYRQSPPSTASKRGTQSEFRSLWRHKSFTGQAVVWDKMLINGGNEGLIEEERGES